MKKIIIFIGIFIVVIFLLIILFCSSNDLVVTKYKLENNKVKNDIRIVQISDFHAVEYGENQSEILNKISEAKPDLIVLSGDMIDEEGSIDNTTKLLDSVQNIAPTFYVAGNHEYRSPNIDSFFNYLDKSKIEHLKDNSKNIRIKDNEITLFGLDDYTGAEYWNREEDEEKRMEKLWHDSNNIKLLLSHHPEMKDLYSKYEYDLIFSGHAHGGQVRFEPLINGVIAPNQGLFPKYTKGIYKMNDKSNLIVSVGLAKNKVPRINNKPEVVIVDLVKKGR
ncbi:MAG: metallophosphoesterase [Erysipelotrichales bacterium]